MGFDYSDFHTLGQVCRSESLEAQDHLTRLDWAALRELALEGLLLLLLDIFYNMLLL